MTDAILLPGFADPVADSQRVFRAVMQSLANPGRLTPLDARVSAPELLPMGLAALILTLCDFETALWLAPELRTASVEAYLRFHTATRLTAARGDAHFAALPALDGIGPLAEYAQGTADYPDRSTTLMVAADALSGNWRLCGPGIETALIAPAPALPEGFAAQWRDNGRRFPCGIDIVFVTPMGLIGLPRTTRILED